MKFKSVVSAALVFILTSSLAEAHELGFAGLLSGKNKGDMPSLRLASGEPLSTVSEINIESGKYYELLIESDGSSELGVMGANFFRAIWIDQVVINGLEVRPLGLDGVEFDDEGEIEIGFVAIKPGTYELYVPGMSGETQRVKVNIR